MCGFGPFFLSTRRTHRALWPFSMEGNEWGYRLRRLCPCLRKKEIPKQERRYFHVSGNPSRSSGNISGKDGWGSYVDISGKHPLVLCTYLRREYRMFCPCFKETTRGRG